MPAFSARSDERLNTCDGRLQALFRAVVAEYDCTVLEGHRSPQRQAELFRDGKSKVRVSRHNAVPSEAADVAPWPIPEKWGAVPNPKVIAQFYHFAGFVLGLAAARSLALRWGGDWDGDRVFTDQSFDDLVHFELKPED